MKFQLYSLIFLYSFLAANCGQKGTVKVKGAPPNILFIFTDDHAKNAMSIYENKLIQTPNLDRIAKEGMVFNRAYVTNSICGPSRAVILTGKYSHINGFRKNGDRFDGSQPNFPKYLQQSNYHTAVVGKWHLGTPPTGFDYSNILIGQGSYYNPVMVENGDTIKHTGHSTDIVRELALNHLDTLNKKNPFCLMVQFKAPHRNWMPHARYFDQFAEDLPLPETFYDDYATRSTAAKNADMRIEDMFMSLDMKLNPAAYGRDTASGGWEKFDPEKSWENHLKRMMPDQRATWDAYYSKVNEHYTENKNNWTQKELIEWKYQRYIKDYLRCVKSVDDNVGHIFDYLEKNNLLENTLIVYSSDQGFYLGEHGWYDKRFMYEESFSTPMAMRFPKRIKPRSVCDELVLNLDLAPTFLDVAGVEIPAGMQGKSLVPLFSNPANNDWRDAIYYHYYAHNSWHTVQRHEGVRTKNHKLIYFYDQPAWELYDLQKDPNEINNQSGQAEYADLEIDLKNKLAGLRVKYGLQEN
ncbi:MAG: sulfatase [Bacteroidota bacterium]